MYSHSKSLKTFQAILTIFMPVILAILNLHYKNLTPYASLYNIGITLLDNFLLNTLITDLKQQAALIQELFDEQVLKIKTNTFILFERPLQEVIEKYNKRYISKHRNHADLKNWYPKEISNIGEIGGQLIAQRINSWWDSNLRKLYKIFLIIIGSVLLFTVTVVASYQDISLNNFISHFVIPLLPIFNFIIREYLEVQNSNEVSNKLLKSVRSTYDSALTGKAILQLSSEIKSNQLMILRHRIDSVLIMDWFYWFYKKAYETDMKCNVKVFITELSQYPKLQDK